MIIKCEIFHFQLLGNFELKLKKIYIGRLEMSQPGDVWLKRQSNLTIKNYNLRTRPWESSKGSP